MKKSKGKIIREPGLNVLEHEMKTADALAENGYIVEFVRKSEVDFEKSADVLINGVKWEMKAPKSSNIKTIDRNLRRAIKQSKCIIFDSRRMKNIPDKATKHELTACAYKHIQGIEHLIFVNRKGEVIDIK